MKIKVYWITIDQHNSGVETELFATEADFDARLAEIVRERADEIVKWEDESDPMFKAASKAIELLDAGKVNSTDKESAWDVFTEGPDGKWQHALQHPDDAYHYGHETLEMPMEVQP